VTIRGTAQVLMLTFQIIAARIRRGVKLYFRLKEIHNFRTKGSSNCSSVCSLGARRENEIVGEIPSEKGGGKTLSTGGYGQEWKGAL